MIREWGQWLDKSIHTYTQRAKDCRAEKICLDNGSVCVSEMSLRPSSFISFFMWCNCNDDLGQLDPTKSVFLFFSFVVSLLIWDGQLKWIPRSAACSADRLEEEETSDCVLLRFLEHSGGQGNKQQHECNSSSTEMTASSVDAPDAPIEGLLAELDSNANTNWSFSKVAYRSPSLFVKRKCHVISIGWKNQLKKQRKPEDDNSSSGRSKKKQTIHVIKFPDFYGSTSGHRPMILIEKTKQNKQHRRNWQGRGGQSVISLLKMLCSDFLV